jgi:hypothetical protein
MLTLSLLLLAQGTVSGETKTWHRVTITFDGPSTSETATPNPFRDYRLDVTFTKGGRSLKVPGFYAADGNAAETSATSGGKWRVRFCPDEAGTWTYTASFRTGTDIAASTDAAAGSATSFHGATGSFTVAATDKTGRDHRAKGRLRYVGKHQLQFAQTGEYFLKGGADSPENLLAYGDFDATPAKHAYAPHAGDWNAGDPVWKTSKGKNLIGALNYLAGKGMNSVYFLTMNVNGDGRDVWPWTSDAERYRFDVSKLDQWEIVFSHMDKLGLKLHVVTQETENDQLLDGGALGVQRKIYYRELVARFAHHLAVVWNVGEENTNTDAQRKAFADHLRLLDPYDNPIVVHTYPGQYDAVYGPLLGHGAYEGPSLQMGSAAGTHAETVEWVQRSAQSGRRWFVSLDEIGPAGDGVLTDAEDFNHDGPRKNALWGNLMGGGAGVEWYFGYNHPHTDLTCEDWRSRDNMWNLTRHALDFFRQHLPFQDMTPNDGLVSTGWCLNKGGEVYAVYLPNGGSANLTVGSGTYSVRWYSPRSGGGLQTGSTSSVTGPGARSLGSAPSATTSDWAVVVRLTGGTGGGTLPTVTGLTLVNADTDADLGPLTAGQTINLATLPTRNLNVRANVANAASVRFGLDANASYRVESTAPFALAGDTAGNYNAWTPTTGAHTVTATPYGSTGATGTAGPALSVSFTVVDEASNAPPTVTLTSPANGATFAAGSTITITAGAADADGNVAFVDFLRGGTVLGMDTTSPYSYVWTSVPAGTYTLAARATDNDAAATTSAAVTITVTGTTAPSVQSFTLINADTDQPMAGFDPLNSGASINLAGLPTRNLNIRAHTSPSVVGSVRFGYDGNANVRVENGAPYALAGDTSGNYYAWTPATGSHTLTATPYSASGAGGTAGTSKTITFTVTDTGGATLLAASGAPSDPSQTGEEEGAAATDAVDAGSEGSNCGALGLELLIPLAAAALRRRRA